MADRAALMRTNEAPARAYRLEMGPDDAEARFSHDGLMRYSLRRFVTAERVSWRSVAFVLLNPSTADAFKLDPTVGRCVKWAAMWGFDACEIANVFALRSPWPADLYTANREGRALGVDNVNDAHILSMCERADLVVVGYGNHGDDARLGRRGSKVISMLAGEWIELHHLGLNKDGSPKHPLARGRNRIPDNIQPARFAA